MCKHFFILCYLKFYFDPDLEMDPDPDPELPEKSDLEIIFSDPTHCLLQHISTTPIFYILTM